MVATAQRRGGRVCCWSGCAGAFNWARTKGDPLSPLCRPFRPTAPLTPLLLAPLCPTRPTRILAPGLSMSAFLENPALGKFWKVLSLSLDKQGAAYISTMEGRSYPFTATQWHPEKNPFEWTPALHIPHTFDAVGRGRGCGAAAWWRRCRGVWEGMQLGGVCASAAG